MNWFEIIYDGDLAKIELAIHEGIDLNQRNQLGHTALYLAILYRKYNVLDRLLAEESLIIPPDSMFVYFKMRLVVEKLLKVPRFNVNYVNALGHSILHIAILNNRSDIIELLINDPRIDVNIPDMQGDTPLHKIVSSKFCNEEQAIKLINRPDTNLNVRNIFGYTPLYLAILNSQIDVVNKLLQDPSRIDVNLEQPLGWSALQTAIDKGLLESVILLIKANADLTFKDKYGKTALDHAIQVENNQIIAELESASNFYILK